MLKDVSFVDFWDNSEYAVNAYISENLTDELLKSIVNELGYKLPSSYVEFMRLQNGGIPKNSAFPTKERTSWAIDHVAIRGILGIARSIDHSICGELGSKFMMDEWGYPDLGVYFADCPSGGHDMICLDYQKCGKEGEPQVVHVVPRK